MHTDFEIWHGRSACRYIAVRKTKNHDLDLLIFNILRKNTFLYISANICAIFIKFSQHSSFLTTYNLGEICRRK